MRDEQRVRGGREDEEEIERPGKSPTCWRGGSRGCRSRGSMAGVTSRHRSLASICELLARVARTAVDSNRTTIAALALRERMIRHHTHTHIEDARTHIHTQRERERERDLLATQVRSRWRQG